MKKLLPILLAAAMLFAVSGCGESKTDDTSGTDDSGAQQQEDNAELLSGLHHAEITIKDYGTLYVELDADAAPVTVTNFVTLAKDGFYDGLTFHRIISGFMIQGGDPNGDGSGGSDTPIKGEFSDNGYENTLSHTRGTLSMARRSNDYDSASSQFFIMHEDQTSIDGQYAAFGHVTEGMEIVDRICEQTPVQDNNGTVLAEDQPVIESIVITD